MEMGDSSKTIAPFWASVSLFLKWKQYSFIVLGGLVHQYHYQKVFVKTELCLALYWAW